MKISILFVLLYLLTVVSFGQNTNVTIGNKHFVFKKMFVENDNGDSAEQLQIYDDDQKVLSHTISLIEGDCNSESVQLGGYETQNNRFILYTYWTRTGDAPVSPYGFRKQIYSVDEKGRLILVKGIIYIETTRKGWYENKGMDFLFKKPANKEQRQQLKDYIANVETAYQATFVKGADKEALIKEVGHKLRKEIATTVRE
jgi:hypothetical protein